MEERIKRLIEKNKVWLPMDLEAEYKSTSLPEDIVTLDHVDYFLDCLTVPMLMESRECFLRMHVDVYYLMRDQNFEIGAPNGSITRYRGYLLLIDSRVPRGLIQVGRIFDEIENLLNLQASFSPYFGYKEKQTLEYLEYNRYRF